MGLSWGTVGCERDVSLSNLALSPYIGDRVTGTPFGQTAEGTADQGARARALHNTYITNIINTGAFDTCPDLGQGIKSADWAPELQRAPPPKKTGGGEE